MSSPALYSGQRSETGGALTASSLGTELTTGAANTKGSYIELIAATAFQASGLFVQFGIQSAAEGYLYDIAIGAAASEQVIVPNLSMSQQLRGSAAIFIPLSIPAGSRIAMRAQALGATRTTLVSVSLFGGGTLARALQLCTAYGAVTASSQGTTIDPGGTANTKGSWVELTAATTATINHLLLVTGHNGDFDRAANQHWLMDVAIGAAASEQVIVPNLQLAMQAVADVVAPRAIGFDIHIPAGTRIAARAQCNVNTASDRLFDLIAYGFS